jgi:hypothetical protein
MIVAMGDATATVAEPKVTLADVALAEFTALRSEVQSIRQIQTAVYTAALTILAAVGGFALAKKEGRLEMLLVLPLVLSGLGLILVEAETGISNIGEYIREKLSSRLPANQERMSWEMFIFRRRSETGARYALLGGAAPALILVVPSIASLWITDDQLGSHLWPLWWSGAVAAVACVGMLIEHLRRVRKEGKQAAGSLTCPYASRRWVGY